MPKLPVLKSRQVIKKFQKLGFVKDRQSGSHVVLYRFKDKKRAVIPLHLGDLPKGTLKAILHQTGITEKEFVNI